MSEIVRNPHPIDEPEPDWSHEPASDDLLSESARENLRRLAIEAAQRKPDDEA